MNFYKVDGSFNFFQAEIPAEKIGIVYITDRNSNGSEVPALQESFNFLFDIVEKGKVENLVLKPIYSVETV